MFNRIKRLFVPGEKSAQDGLVVSSAGITQEEDIPRYPPFVRGLPMCPPERIIETQLEHLARIRTTLGLTPKEHETLILPLIRNCAAFVHLLPASEAHHHRGAGGLFRHSLEVGAWAAQFAEGRIFTYMKTPLERKQEEPRWVVATFTAALMHDIGKAASDMAVTNADGSSEWVPYMETLWEWGQRNKVDRYFVRWRHDRHKKHEQTGLLLTNHVLPTPLKAWLGEHTHEIIGTMLEATTCTGNHVITQLVIRADSTSVDQDLKKNPSLGNEMSVGVPVERHILDASRRLINNGTWTVNKKGSRVWVTKEGVFIAWKAAAEEIVALLAEDRAQGIPRDKDTLADLMLERDLAIWNDEEDAGHKKRYWSLSPAVLDGRGGALWLQCLKLRDPALVFSSEPPAPARVSIKLAGENVRLLEGSLGMELANPPTSSDLEEDPAEQEKQPAKPNVKPEKQKNEPKQLGMKLVAPQKDDAASPQQTEVDTTHQASESINSPVVSTPAPVAKPVRLPESEPAPAVDGALDASEKWLAVQSHDAGDLLAKLLHEVGMGIREAAELFGQEGPVVYIRYPDAIRQFAKPADFAQAFSASDWLVPDPENPARKAREMSNGRGLVMTSEVGDHIKVLLRRQLTPSAPKAEPKPSRPQLAPQPESKQMKPAPQSAPAPAAPTPDPSQHPAPAPQPQVQAAPARQTTASSEPGRPPAVVREISAEIRQVVEDFVIQVRAGKIPSTAVTKEGITYLRVGIAQLTKHAKEFSTTLARAAAGERDDCIVGNNNIMVKAE